MFGLFEKKVEWSAKPGCFERHLERRLGNPLFSEERRHVTWRQVKEALDHATTDSKSMPWPNLAGFMALVERNARTERGLNHASRQPVAQVLAQHTGAKAHQLPPETQACKAQRKQVGREHMAKMRQLLD